MKPQPGALERREIAGADGRGRRATGAILLSIVACCWIAFPVRSFAENHLAGSRSRYLLQHATNPIDWYPWSDEALAKAGTAGKLIFLSIGYSTCHWCQVMETESFSDVEVARVLNESFVSIKVDREERPDIDSVFLGAARVLAGDAGWPNNLILAPDGRPLFATSYVPRERLLSILSRVSKLWVEQPDRLTASADILVRELASRPPDQEGELNVELLAESFRLLAARFDRENGGFLPAPKFPRPHQLMFLLRYWRRTGDARALDMVETTLRTMKKRAIWDDRDFGFHRYTSDASWNEPHREKMLCDQALLAIAHLEAYQATGRKEYADTARKTFVYVLRNLRSDDGAFFSAQDADESYYEANDRRRMARPGRDEKILTDWNGLMIAALAFGGAVLHDPALSKAAREAADTILASRRGGRLPHTSGQPAFLDDYAMLVWGLLNLYETTGEVRDLDTAITLLDDSIHLFADDEGRFFISPDGVETPLFRPRELIDGAIPSGNSVQLANLVRIARITGARRYENMARALARSTTGELGAAGSEAAHFLSALGFLLGPSHEIVLSGDQPSALRNVVAGAFAPDKVLLYRPIGDAPPITRIAPYTKQQLPLRGITTAYVCTMTLCRQPTTDPATLRRLMNPARGH